MPSQDVRALTSVLSETRLTFAEAARRLPGRGSPHRHPSAVYRYAVRGAKAVDGRLVRLEAVKCGQTWYTSAEALDRFLVALSSPADPAPAPRSPSARAKASAAAAKQLEELGA